MIYDNPFIIPEKRKIRKLKDQGIEKKFFPLFP
jgi:hypothetical protein